MVLVTNNKRIAAPMPCNGVCCKLREGWSDKAKAGSDNAKAGLDQGHKQGHWLTVMCPNQRLLPIKL